MSFAFNSVDGAVMSHWSSATDVLMLEALLDREPSLPNRREMVEIDGSCVELGEAGDGAGQADEGVSRLDIEPLVLFKEDWCVPGISTGGRAVDPSAVFDSGGEAGVLEEEEDFDAQNPKKPERFFCSCCSRFWAVFDASALPDASDVEAPRIEKFTRDVLLLLGLIDCSGFVESVDEDWAPAFEDMLLELFADCATLEITWADLDMAVWIVSAVVAALYEDEGRSM